MLINKSPYNTEIKYSVHLMDIFSTHTLKIHAKFPVFFLFYIAVKNFYEIAPIDNRLVGHIDYCDPNRYSQNIS